MDKPTRCMLPFLIIILIMVIGFGVVFLWSSNNFKVIMVSSQNMQLLDGKMTIFFLQYLKIIVSSHNMDYYLLIYLISIIKILTTFNKLHSLTSENISFCASNL